MGKEHLNSSRAPRNVEIHTTNDYLKKVGELRPDRSQYPQLTGSLREIEVALQNTAPEPKAPYVHTGFELGAL